LRRPGRGGEPVAAPGRAVAPGAATERRQRRGREDVRRRRHDRRGRRGARSGAEHRRERPASIAPWVNDATYSRVAAAARQSDGNRLKPIFEALGGEVPYNEIRLVLSHVQNVADQSPPRA
jgi:hypothetical protein